MWSSIESLKHNLSKIALDVHDDDGELEIYDSVNADDLSSISHHRRNSHSLALSNSVSRSPVANGIDSPFNFEIDQYKSEIKRLQDSEAQIKALSVNYAALLKEKEDQISRLNQENGSLKQNLDATKEALNLSRNENSRTSTSNINGIKGSGDQSSKRQHKSPTQVKNRHAGNQMHNGVFSKQDGVGNGVANAAQDDGLQSNMEYKYSNSLKEKELADLLEKNRSMAVLQATQEQQIKQLRVEHERQHDKLANLQLKLQEEQKLNESFQEELKMLKTDKNNTLMEMSKIRKELDEKILEIKRLQTELSRSEKGDVDEIVKNLKRAIANLEKENTSLKMTKNELEAAAESKNSLTVKISADGVMASPKKEEMELLLQKMERELKDTLRERDKALQELARLKQHLLEKESEESEKMYEDSKIIEELRENNEYQKAQIIHLERELKQAVASQEEVRMSNSSEIQQSKEIIEDLNKKLANCMRVIDSQSVELQNLQTALGQYFAEIEAKEHLEQQLALAREESARLSALLKDAEQGMEASNREKQEILSKLSLTERTLAEGKNRVNKLEEDNAKLRRALEQSMTRLNRMSVDSDYLVDRRIVIKLLVTYFQRNHSKEVLDLMVRMLGFSDDDKQRIGMAQQGGKGVVRGVLGLPGRLVGGILGGSSVDAREKAASENQSFADLWVDFLLMETEEREKRESMEDTSGPNKDSRGRSPDSNAGVGLPMPNHASSSTIDSVSRSKFSTHNHGPLPSQGNLQPFEHSDSEFSTVPLTSLENSSSRIPRLLQKQ